LHKESSPLYRAKRKEIAQRAILAKEPDCSGGRGEGGEYGIKVVG